MSGQHPYSLQGVFLQTPSLSEILFGQQERTAFAAIADAVMQCFTGKQGSAPSPHRSSGSQGPTSASQLEGYRMMAAMQLAQQNQAQR
jgi:hypothetical protein